MQLHNNKINNEKWEVWQPVENLDLSYSIKSVTEDFDGLKVILYSKQQKDLFVDFAKTAIAYRNTDESYRLTLMDDLIKKYSTDIFRHSVFFKVEYSSYVKWLIEQRLGIEDEFNLKHIVIVSNDSFFEVICGQDPKVKFL